VHLKIKKPSVEGCPTLLLHHYFVGYLQEYSDNNSMSQPCVQVTSCVHLSVDKIHCYISKSYRCAATNDLASVFLAQVQTAALDLNAAAEVQ